MEVARPPAVVAGMQLTFMPAEAMRRRAVAEIRVQNTRDQRAPRAMGPMDERMGGSTATSRCKTCGNSPLVCWGHAACIPLPMPIYSPILTKQVLKPCRCVCYACCKPLLRKGDPKEVVLPPIGDPRRLDAMHKQATRRKKRGLACPWCGVLQPYLEVPRQRIQIISDWKLKGGSELNLLLGHISSAEKTKSEKKPIDPWRFEDDGSPQASEKVPIEILARNTWLLTENERQELRDIAKEWKKDTEKKFEEDKAQDEELEEEKGKISKDNYFPEEEAAVLRSPKAWLRKLQQGLFAFRVFAARPWNAAMTFAVLDGMSQETVKHIGITGVSHAGMKPKWTDEYLHPRHMMLRVFPVTPPSCRQSLVVVEGSKREKPDDLTTATTNLAKQARMAWKHARGTDLYGPLKSKNSVPVIDYEMEWKNFHLDEHPIIAKTGFDHLDVPTMTAAGMNTFMRACPALCSKLQEEAACVIANDGRKTAKMTSRNNAPLETIKKLIDGKKGIFRQNLLGNRCDFTARSVIYGDAFIAVDQVAIPESMANRLSYPVKVTEINRADLQRRVHYGDNREAAPAHLVAANVRGARCVKYEDGTVVLLKYLDEETRASLPLPIGAEVHRWVIDDDVGLFNRQPSLHKYAIMAFRLLIREKGYAIGMNPLCTGPFNADFDGDEMNLHIPQTEQARAEALILMSVAVNNVNVRNSSMTFGLVQDPLTQAHRLGSRDVFFNQEEFMQLVAQIEKPRNFGKRSLPPPAVFYKKNGVWHKQYTGKQVWSLLLRDQLFMDPPVGKTAKDIFNDPEESVVLIREGELLAGRLQAAQLKTGRNSLSHLMALYVGKSEATQFLSDTQRVMNYALLRVGFTSSPSHMRPPDAVYNHAKTWVDSTLDRLRTVLRRPGMEQAPQKWLEAQISKVLMYVMMFMSKTLLGAMDRTKSGAENCIVRMIRAKAKGSPMNIMQIGGGIGQQTVQNTRLCGGVVRRRERSVPSMMPGDSGAVAGGFVPEPFLAGLTPEGSYFHDNAGREGLVNTSVRTAETGYNERQSASHLQPAVAEADGSVTYGGTLLQELYGADGFDASWLHPVFVPPIVLSDLKIIEAFAGHLDIIEELQKWRNTYRGGGIGTWTGPRLTVKPGLPFSLHKLLQIEVRKSCYKTAITTQNWSKTALPALKDFFAKLLQLRTLKSLLPLFMSCLWDSRPEVLTPVQGVDKTKTFTPQSRGVSLEEYKAALQNALVFFHRALISDGEACGVQAAQSIGAPATQGTLDTFHQTGFSEGVQVIHGFQRQKELLNTSTASRGKTKTPTMLIAVREQVSDAQLERHVRSLITSQLSSLVETSMVCYDPVRQTGGTRVREDIDLVARCESLFGLEIDMIPGDIGTVAERSKVSPAKFVLRVILDRERTRAARLTPAIVSRAISKHQMWCSIMHSDETDSEWVLRIRLWKNETDVQCRRALSVMLRDAKVAGLGSIGRAVVLRKGEQRVGADGSLESVERRRVLTEGTAFMAVAKLPWVDWPATLTNNVYVVYRALGVHAAVMALIRELRQVINGDGKEAVGLRHIVLLAQSMAITGAIRPVTHNGFRNTPEMGALATAAFEKGTETIADASMRGTVDALTSSTQNVLLGQRVPVGTGRVHLITEESLSKCIIPHHKSGPLVKEAVVSSRGTGIGFYDSEIGVVAGVEEGIKGVARPISDNESSWNDLTPQGPAPFGATGSVQNIVSSCEFESPQKRRRINHESSLATDTMLRLQKLLGVTKSSKVDQHVYDPLKF